MGCPEMWWSLHLWIHLDMFLCGLLEAIMLWQGVRFNDLQRSPPTATNLLFCEVTEGKAEAVCLCSEPSGITPQAFPKIIYIVMVLWPADVCG